MMPWALLLVAVAVVALAAKAGIGARVRYRERAAGVIAELGEFLDWWEANGPFDVVVAVDGGVRYDEATQRAYYEAGASKAPTLSATPHGRAAAVDLVPSGFDPRKPIDAVTYRRFLTIGESAEARGLVWGGRWLRAFPPSSVNPYGGDLPHVEVRNWAALPYPPRSSVA